MTQDVFAQKGSAANPDSRDERAQRAVKVFRAIQPGLSGMARAFTGRRDAEVVLDNGTPRTDGKKIYYKPPIALGDLTPHQRRYCDRRDKTTKLQLCPACKVREEVIISIIHEIAHIAFKTFEQTTPRAQAEALERAIKEAGSKWGNSLRQTWEGLPASKKNDYLNLSSLVSPYLPLLVNGLEDARVDEAMFKVRKGTRIMFDAYVQSIFASGIEADNGEMVEWRDKPLNSQVIIGVFVLASKYTYEGWFSPEVEEALSDKELRELCDRVSMLRSAAGTYELAFPMLARLRELGFCRLPDDPDEPVQEPESDDDNSEQEPEQDDSSDQEEQEKSDDDSGPTTPGPGDAESDEPQDGKEAGKNPGSPEEENENAEDGDGDESGESSDGDSSDESGADPSESSDQDDGDSGLSPGQGGDDSADEESGDVREDSEEADDSESDDSDSGDVDSSATDDGDDDDSGNGTSAGDNSDDAERSSTGGNESDSESQSEGGSAGGDGLDEQRDDSEHQVDDDSESSGDGSNEDSDGGANEDDESKANDESEANDESDSGRDGAAGLSGQEPDESADEELLADEADQGQPPSLTDLEDDESEEAVDSGADEGKGGTSTDEADYGTPDDVIDDVHAFNQHEIQVIHVDPEQAQADEEAVDLAIIQGQYFEKPSAYIAGVREHFYGKQTISRDGKAWTKAWDHGYSERLKKKLGIDADLVVEESILGPVLVQMRKTFAENRQAKMKRHLKSGRVNGRVLGKRAWSGDDRLFQKKRLPGKRSYAVLIGIDISGSTVGKNLALAKRAAMAQAEMCHRTGIDFAIYAHTANGNFKMINGQYYYEDLYLDMYQIKGFDDSWDKTTKEALGAISSDSENLDGHGIEYYRKAIERHPATDKIILYYTDGKMPAANYDEELEILVREINYCKAHKITLCGVGIRTDSPRRHGLDTVEVHDDSDLVKVVRHLETVLLHNR